MNSGREETCVSNREIQLDSLAERLKGLLPLDYKTWNYQDSYTRGVKNRWTRSKQQISSAHYRRHLDPNDRYWIGFPAYQIAGRPVTSFVILDFDANKRHPTTASSTVAWERLEKLVEYIGREFPPVVFTTPGGGYHALWFLEDETPLWRLVDQDAPESHGLLFDVIRAALGSAGRATCEVYPQQGHIIRWPLGTDQRRVDLASGSVIDENVESAVAALEHHRWNEKPLPVAHLASIRPTEPERKRILLAERGVTAADVQAAKQYACKLADVTIAYAQRLYREGLTEPRTRNSAMFALALCMVHAPASLTAFGFNPGADPSGQLLTWLEAKHNGMSNDYAGPEVADRHSWLAECRRVVTSAAKARVAPDGFYLITNPEWDAIFRIGDLLEGDCAERFHLELVAACAVRKAKSSVLQRNICPDADGTYRAEIHSKWWQQIPFCKHYDGLKKYRGRLIEIGFIDLAKRGSQTARRANIYSGFRLHFGAQRPNLPYSPVELRELVRLLQVDSAVPEFCLVAAQRFSDEAMLTRYGAKGVKYINGKLSELEAIAPALGQRSLEQAA